MIFGMLSNSNKRNKLLNLALKYILYIGPAAILYIVFVLKPIFNTIFLSLYKWDGASLKIFLGLANYLELFKDNIFWIALRNNFIWIVASLLLPMLLGLLIAVVLSNVKYGRFFFQFVYFMPVVLNLVIVGVIWCFIYNPIFGVLNTILINIGLPQLTQGWLGDPFWVMPSIILAGNWTFFGFCMIIFLAGLQNIDKSIYEAAMVDGANKITQFTKITIPMLKNQITLLIVYSIVGSFKVFDIVYVMTKGGPNHSSEVLANYLYWQAFSNGRVGYATAMAAILILVVLILSVSTLHNKGMYR